MKKICIIGLGNIGQSIFDLWKEQSSFEVHGCTRQDDINECILNSDIIFLAVKPQSFYALADSIKVDLREKLVCSLMAGVTIEKVKKTLKTEKVARAMPNLPLKVRQGFTGWIASDEVNDSEKMILQALFCYFGEEMEVDDEEKLHAITALSGSGPAYFYFLEKCLFKKAKEYGFSEKQAKKIAKCTFLGSGRLRRNLEDDPDDLIEKISSKGGTTERAIKYLEEKAESQILQAIEKAYIRSKELNDR